MRATTLGISSTSAEHADGALIEFVDPDGIALRVVHSANGPQDFIGVLSMADAGFSFSGAPRPALPTSR